MKAQLTAIVVAIVGFVTWEGNAAESASPAPEWIWFKKSNGAETRYFRKVLKLDAAPSRADLVATADDGLEVFVNGQSVLKGEEWARGHRADVKSRLKAGANVVAVRAHNGDSSPAGLLLRLRIETPTGRTVLTSDATWKAAERVADGWNQVAFDDGGWASAQSLGKLGMAPWGNVLSGNARAAAEARRDATPAEAIYALKDFKVELLISAGPEDGSWVNLCRDDRGRLILSPQYRSANDDGGLIRVTLAADGTIAKRELIAKPLYDAQGMVFANGALWVMVNKYSTKFESGLYRITDDGSDTWNRIELVKKMPGGGEHGPHAVEPGPDGNLWVMAGNHTKPPAGLSPDSPHRNYAEDHMLPRQPDGNGHATGVMAPGGYICRVSPDGAKWDFFCGGFRNSFDFAFNVDGELFVFDADMEWDWGMPWYRPTRLNHAVSGAEFGWRYGTGKWPDYYADSLGSAVDIGVGCPTGVRSGQGAKYPAKYQQAIYIMDWTFGRLMAVHLKPAGASYTATWENFVAPLGLVDATKEKATLNLTDMVIGNDGAMYFTTGGRNTAAGLYRVTYRGSESTAPAWKPNAEGAEARALRHRLEAFHGKVDPAAVEAVWPHLASPDRSIRYAARIALEAQPPASWMSRVASADSVDTGLGALLALARVGDAPAQAEVWKAPARWPLGGLTERQQLDELRVLQVSIARHGLPPAEVVQDAIGRLYPLFPSASRLVNRELSQVLIALGAPDVVGKCLAVMASARTSEEVNHYLFHLRTAKNWTADQRREYLSYWTPDRRSLPHQQDIMKWFEEAGRAYADGASYNNFMKNFLKDVRAGLTPAERPDFEPIIASIADSYPARRASDFPPRKQRSLVKAWTMADFADDLAKPDTGRNFERGRQAFVDAQCISCHRMGVEGGGVGPDLTAVGARFKRIDVLESILDPSKVLSEQYQNITVELKDGEDHTGRLVDETTEELVLVPNQLEPNQRITVKKSDVKERRPSTTSPMPTALADVLSHDELLDLVAFLESGGRASHPVFQH